MTSSSKTSKTTRTCVPARQRPKTTLSPVLRTVTIADAVAEFRTLDARSDLVPAPARPAVEVLLNQIAAAGLANAAQLVADQTHLLQILTGVDRAAVRSHQPTEVAERLHTSRNVIIAVAAVAAASVGADPAGVYDNSVTLLRRTMSPRRPLTDDEVLLARVAVRLHSIADPRSATAGVYSLVEAGMVPGETTLVTLSDFSDCDGHEVSSHVLAPGNGHLASRFLPLDSYTRHVLGRLVNAATLAQVDAAKPLLYTPRDAKNLPGSPVATASAQGVLDRLLKSVGLFQDDTTASSIYLWRVQSTYLAAGVDAALEISGRSTASQMFQSLGQHRTKQEQVNPDEGFSFESAA